MITMCENCGRDYKVSKKDEQKGVSNCRFCGYQQENKDKEESEVKDGE